MKIRYEGPIRPEDDLKLDLIQKFDQQGDLPPREVHEHEIRSELAGNVVYLPRRDRVLASTKS